MEKFLEVKNLDSLRETKLVRYINPMDIKYLPVKDFRVDSFAEKIANGDWDKNLTLLDDSEFSIALEDAFIKDIPWDKTAYFSGTLQKAQIRTEGDRFRYKKLRCDYINYLVNAMKTFGYVQDPNSNLVGLNIGRNGEVILNNGRHRASIAKFLSIPSIPVTIDVRHSEWVAFCDTVYDYAVHHRGRVYEPIKHIDLKHLPSRQVDRSSLIIKHMSPRNSSLVDLGANWGQMCQELEGYYDHCVAVENDPIEFGFLKKFKKAYGCSYDIAEMDIVDFIKAHPSWDCVLMLSILHHIPIARRDELFSSLDAKEMFFQFPSKNEKEVNIPDWITIILAVSCFNKAKQIGSKSNREIFHFTR